MKKDAIRAIKDLIVTKSDLNEFLFQIEEVNGSLYNTKESPERALAQALSREKKDVILAYAESAGSSSMNPADIQKILQEVKETLLKLPVIEFKVAFEPAEQFILRLVEWVHQYISPDAIIEVKVDRNIIGGVQISYNGRYHDYSVIKYLQEIQTRK
jgi:F0F1-type ATP synthase delta subunit